MKLLAYLLVLVTLAGAISGASKEKRAGIGAAIGLNIGATVKPARPTIPPLINLLTSNLFTPNQTSGESPIYSLLRLLTSNIYPFVSNTTYNSLTPLNNLINQFSSNLYNGICGPPVPNITNPWGWTTGAPGAATTAPPATNPITNIINLLTGNGGTTPTGTNPLSQILSALTGAAGNSTTSITNLLNTIAGAVGQHFGNDAASIQNLINSILGTTGGTTGTATTVDPLTALLNSLGLTGTGGINIGINLGGPFPGITVTGGVNTTLNLSPAAFNQLLSSIGQTVQSLQTALQNLGWSAQQFVNGLAAAGNNAATYLQNIFAQAAASLNANPYPGLTVTGSVNTTLNLSPAAFNQLLSSIGQTVQSLQTALQNLGWSAQQFVNGLATAGNNAATYLQNIFAQAAASLNANPYPGLTVTGSVNTTLNLSPAAFNQLLSSIGQTVQTLQAALQKLSATAQIFVNGLAAYNGNALAYLQAIFNQANAGGTNTLQGLINNVLNSLNGILGNTGLLNTINTILASLGLSTSG